MHTDTLWFTDVLLNGCYDNCFTIVECVWGGGGGGGYGEGETEILALRLEASSGLTWKVIAYCEQFCYYD